MAALAFINDGAHQRINGGGAGAIIGVISPKSEESVSASMLKAKENTASWRRRKQWLNERKSRHQRNGVKA
jgi:hypothetical protein